MSEKALIKFENVIKNLPRGLRTSEIIDHLEAESVFSKSEADEVVRVFAELYSIKSEDRTDLNELVDGVCDALNELDDDSLKPADGDWDKFKTHFKLLLSMDSTIGISFKAFRLSIQNEKTYVDANIFSDIRPAFSLDVERGFDTAVIIHNLQIEYHTDRTHKEIQIALDCEDIRKLKELLDRAENKEASMRRQFESTIAFLAFPKS